MLRLPLLGDHRVEAALFRLHLGAAVLATRSRVLWVMNHSRPPPTTTNDVALAASSHGFLMLASRPRKSGNANLKPAPPPPVAFRFLPGSK